MRDPKHRKASMRVLFLTFGCVAIAFGAAPILRGHLVYGNKWGNLIYAPIVVLVGLFAILVALFKPPSLD